MQATHDGMTIAASDSEEDAASEAMAMEEEPPAPLRNEGVDLALNICSFLAPTHVEVPMQAERSL